MDLEAMKKRLTDEAARLGLPFGNRTRTYNSRLAQEVGKWAESEGVGSRFHAAAFQAYFADGLNLAEEDVLVSLARGVGLSAQQARKVIEDRLYKEAVDHDWQLALDMGIRAVPTLAVGQQTLVGARPYEQMHSFLRGNGVRPRRP
jgi:predicted DsbA family dithiol-disulfide isomerase